MKKYEKSHPWLKFALNVKDFPPTLWFLLGEATSKCDHIAYVPLKPEIKDVLHKIYLAKGVHATTAIEGNTLTEEEVLDHLNGKLEVHASKAYQAREVQNIIDVCNNILTDVMQGKSKKISVDLIKAYNKQIFKELEIDEKFDPGELRRHPVGVAHYKGAPSEDLEFLLQRLCDWLNKDFQIEDMEFGKAYALIKAVLAHLYVAWIHPFGDGNGRTARLIEFQILMSSGFSWPASHLLSNHYNITRNEYYRHLRESSESDGNPIPFLKYAIKGFVDGIREQIKHIRFYLWDVVWRDYVYDFFKDKDKATDKRRRDLVLALSDKKDWPVSKVRDLGPRVAENYYGKSQQIIINDIKLLVEYGLIMKTKEGIRANREKILTLLPPRMMQE